jgi:hypothetical protein
MPSGLIHRPFRPFIFDHVSKILFQRAMRDLPVGRAAADPGRRCRNVKDPVRRSRMSAASCTASPYATAYTVARRPIGWVSDGETEARRYLADHITPNQRAPALSRGTVTMSSVTSRSCGSPTLPDSGTAAFHWSTRSPWPGPFRRQDVATLLMDAAEQPARDRGIATLGLPSACMTSKAHLRGCTPTRVHS